jgi:NCAIR mutase (PurE)-related protein
MDVDRLRSLLEQVKSGEMAVEGALNALRSLPFEDLGFAKLDHHRALRNGFPEVIYCPGKSTDHIVTIAERLALRSRRVLASRASAEVAEAVQFRFPNAVYHPLPKMLVIPGEGEQAAAEAPEPALPSVMGTVLIVSAGTADLPVAEEAAITAIEMGSPVERLYDVGVAGIHRLLGSQERLYAANVLVVVAGMEGALASVVGGLVARPVIAVPTSVGYGASFHGLAALLTMLNSCATGIGVVNIDNGFGAGYLAHLINQPALLSSVPSQP